MDPDGNRLQLLCTASTSTTTVYIQSLTYSDSPSLTQIVQEGIDVILQSLDQSSGRGQSSRHMGYITRGRA